MPCWKKILVIFIIFIFTQSGAKFDLSVFGQIDFSTRLGGDKNYKNH